jgi:hypothetical protein
MPKYVKLFESFISDAKAYALVPTSSAVKTWKDEKNGSWLNDCKRGRVYVLTDTKLASDKVGNVLVYLNAADPSLISKLESLGGKKLAVQSGELTNADSTKYKFYGAVGFTLDAPATGDSVLSNISNVLNGLDVTPANANAGNTTKETDAGKSYADQFFGKDIADKIRAFRDGKAAANATLTSDKIANDPKIQELIKKAGDRAKAANITDLAKGTTSDGKIDKEYSEIKKQIAARQTELSTKS